MCNIRKTYNFPVFWCSWVIFNSPSSFSALSNLGSAMGEEASEGGSLKSWDDIECWEPEETGPAARLGQRLKAQVLEAEEQGCQMRFLKEGCKTLITARLQEHERIIQEFQKRQKKQVLESWKQATSISKFRLKRLGRAMDYWKFVVDDDEEKQRLTLEDRLCQQEHQLKRYQTVGGIALTAMASTFALALVWFLQDRRWKKKFAGQQMEMQCKLNSKDKDFMVELDKTEQRVEKSHLATMKTPCWRNQTLGTPQETPYQRD